MSILYTGSHKSFPMALRFLRGKFLKCILTYFKCNEIKIGYSDYKGMFRIKNDMNVRIQNHTKDV